MLSFVTSKKDEFRNVNHGLTFSAREGVGVLCPKRMLHGSTWVNIFISLYSIEFYALHFFILRHYLYLQVRFFNVSEISAPEVVFKTPQTATSERRSALFL